MITKKQLGIFESFPIGMLILILSIGLSYFILKLYDEPVRNWLTNKYIKNPKKTKTLYNFF